MHDKMVLSMYSSIFVLLLCNLTINSTNSCPFCISCFVIAKNDHVFFSIRLYQLPIIIARDIYSKKKQNVNHFVFCFTINIRRTRLNLESNYVCLFSSFYFIPYSLNSFGVKKLFYVKQI